MRVALVNPNWCFDGSIYFGCREPHLPLELAYAAALLRENGHDALLVDAQAESLDLPRVRERVRHFAPEMTVVTSAPSYLFWRCAPPELRVPMQTLELLRDVAGTTVIVGPHASTSPSAVLQKLKADVAVLGECEEALLELANAAGNPSGIAGVAYRDPVSGEAVVQGRPRAVDVASLPALSWSSEFLRRHSHHHHRFDSSPVGPGAELEASRGCPYSCTFCAKQNFRDKFRRRPLATVLTELDGLLEAGVEYVYFVDEIFLPDRALLEALVDRRVRFGVQMRIDLFDAELLELLGRAGCVSIEAGVESVSSKGRSLLAKRCRLSTNELIELLLTAKRHVPFVQANLLQSDADDPAEIERFRSSLSEHGVWSNEPVPMFPYPGSPAYSQLWGAPDASAWERAHAHYLDHFASFSDLQSAHPAPLSELERAEHA